MKGPQMASAWRTVQQFISAQGMGIFEVEVDTETKETRCTCPVYGKRGSCKHIQFVNEIFEQDEMSMEEMGKMIKDLMGKVEMLMKAEKAEAEMMGEDEEKKELNDECASKDEKADPADFVQRANIEDSDEDPEYMASKMKEAEARDGDEEKKDGDMSKENKGMDSQLKSIMREISRRDTLASKLSNHIGTFDHSQKTVAEVAKYGVKKLGLSCKAGHEESVLSGYLAASKGNRPVIAAQDSDHKSSGIDAYIRGVK